MSKLCTVGAKPGFSRMSAATSPNITSEMICVRVSWRLVRITELPSDTPLLVSYHLCCYAPLNNIEELVTLG